MSTKEPTLDEIAQAPALADDLSPLARARLIAKASGCIAALAAPGIGGAEGADGSEDWISVPEAAALLGYSERWFYRAKNLPFVKRVSARKLLINRGGLDKWLQSRRS